MSVPQDTIRSKMTPGACFHWHLQSGLLQFGAYRRAAIVRDPFQSPPPRCWARCKSRARGGTSEILVQPRATYRTHSGQKRCSCMATAQHLGTGCHRPCDGLSIAVLRCAGQRPYAREAAGCAVVRVAVPLRPNPRTLARRPQRRQLSPRVQQRLPEAVQSQALQTSHFLTEYRGRILCSSTRVPGPLYRVTHQAILGGAMGVHNK